MQGSINIKDLLYTYDCVIIPDFGGFVKNTVGAKSNSLTYTIYPPAAKITFNKNLQNNDGLLANYISENNNIPYSEAIVILKEWVKEIQSELIKNKKVEFAGVGDLLVDNNDKIIFRQHNEINFLKTSFGLSPVMAMPIEREKLPEKIRREVQAAKLDAKRNSFKSRKYRIAAVLLPLMILLFMIPFLKSDLFNSTFYSDMLPFSFLEKKAYIERTNSPSETELNSNNSFDLKRALAEIPDSVNLISIPLYDEGADILIRLKNADAVSTYVEKSEPMSLGSYYIVGGCFSVVENAQKYLNKLHSEGHSASIIGKRNNLYTVVYGSFSNRKEATEKLKAIRENNASAWLLKN